MNSKNTVNHNEFKPEDAIINSNSEFAVVEAYKSIRTNIMYSMPKTEGAKTIVVTLILLKRSLRLMQGSCCLTVTLENPKFTDI